MATKLCYAIILPLVVLSLAAMANSLVIKPFPLGFLAEIKVQGSIFCLYDRKVKPILGATARAKCQVLGSDGVKRDVVTVSNPADHTGYFSLAFPTAIIPLTWEGAECILLLDYSPLPECNIPLNINGGIYGAPLKRTRSRVLDDHTILFSVEPMFFSVSL